MQKAVQEINVDSWHYNFWNATVADELKSKLKNSGLQQALENLVYGQYLHSTYHILCSIVNVFFSPLPNYIFFDCFKKFVYVHIF